MCKKTPAKIFGIGLLVILAILAIGAITMLLWNWLIPTLFNGPSLTYFQAFGLLILSKILLSSGPGKNHNCDHSNGSKQLLWKKHLKEKMQDGTQNNSEDKFMTETAE